MPNTPWSCHHGISNCLSLIPNSMIKQTLSIAAFLAATASLYADPTPPAWWATRGATNSNTPNPNAAVTQGQLKHFTQKAVDELNSKVVNGAGTELNSLVSGWETEYSTGGHSASNPLPADRHAMTVGQLKWIASKIDASLMNLLYIDMPREWIAASEGDDEIATLGQLKTVFDFDLSAPPGQLPLWWQWYYFFWEQDIDPNGYFDGDSLTNYEEYLLGLDPNNDDSDGDGILDGQVNDGDFTVYPSTLYGNCHLFETSYLPLFLRNDTSSPVTYSINITGNSGPSYSYKDSKLGAITYGWDEISTTGTLLSTISSANDASEPVTITGFTFPFYGEDVSQIHVSSNGVLSIGTGVTRASNYALPELDDLPSLIAPLWDDLNPLTSGDIYYKEETNRLIVQYQNVRQGTGAATFQVVLHSDGRIEFRYKTLTGSTTSSTIGIQGRSGHFGITIAHNQSYLTGSMAIEISPEAPFLFIEPLTGTVPANSVLSLGAEVESHHMPPDLYEAEISVTHNGGGVSPQVIPLQFTVSDRVASYVADSTMSGTFLEGEFPIKGWIYEYDGVYSVELIDNDVKVRDLPINRYVNRYEVTDYEPAPGNHVIYFRVTDALGNVVNLDSVNITILADADRDGIHDDWEILHGLDPMDPYDALDDYDGDGYRNIDEYIVGKDPWLFDDEDGDDMLDGWEYRHGLNVLIDDTALDLDRDGLTNLQEYNMGLEPNNFDTDRDLLGDGWEYGWGLDPDSDVGNDGKDGDPDLDGLSNFLEQVYGTDPTTADTDGDGASDLTEVNQGSDPNDPSDLGLAPSPDEMMTVKIIVGDPSDSHSERWAVEVKDLTTDRVILLHQARDFGTVTPDLESIFKNFRKDHSYEFRLIHVGTDPDLLPTDLSFYPDYDWTFEIYVEDENDTFVNVLSSQFSSHMIIEPWNPATGSVSNTVNLLVQRSALEFPWERWPDRVAQYEAQIVPNRVLMIANRMFLDNQNIPYKSGEEALGVSNFVTTSGLPTNSLFADTVSDPKNFRLQAIVPNTDSSPVPIVLEVIRGATTVATYNYSLTERAGIYARGRFLRLVSDTSDDAASGHGATSDPNNQTILVKLGDRLRVIHDALPHNYYTVSEEITVGRSHLEDDNAPEPELHRKHDIRRLKVRFAVLKNALGDPSATSAQVDELVAEVNERFAQVGIELDVIKDFGSGATGITRPTSILDGFDGASGTLTSPTTDEQDLVALKDGDSNTVDVFIVETMNTTGGKATAYSSSRNVTGFSQYSNWAVLSSSIVGTSPNTFAHELMHILLNHAGHRADPATALFNGTPSTTKAVSGTKRIGPYPDATTATVGEDDAITMRANAENLP
jgi:hypothetical protein